MREVIFEQSNYREAIETGDTVLIKGSEREGTVRSYNDTDKTFMIEFENGELIEYSRGAISKPE